MPQSTDDIVKYERLLWFGAARLSVVTYCAEECRRQGSGELSVGWMIGAWEYAMRRRLEDGADRPTEVDLLRLGRLVEPAKNVEGFRRVNVRIGRSVKMSWYSVIHAVEELLEQDHTPAEWYRRYEEIHPFVDGNGRTGAILFNWLNGSLGDPVWPPDFWQNEPPLPVAKLPDFFLNQR